MNIKRLLNIVNYDFVFVIYNAFFNFTDGSTLIYSGHRFTHRAYIFDLSVPEGTVPLR